MARSPFGINWNDKREVINYCKDLESNKYKQVVWERQGNIPSTHSRYCIGFFSNALRDALRDSPIERKAVYITGVGEIQIVSDLGDNS